MLSGERNDVVSPRALRSAQRPVAPTDEANVTRLRFAVVIERTTSGFCAYAPDLVGCVSTGRSVEAVEAAMSEAIAGHLEELRDSGTVIPSPSATVTFLDVAI